MALSTTSFKSDRVRAKILDAMRLSMRKGAQVIKNRNNKGYLVVRRVQGRIVRCFQFTDKHGNDVTEIVYRGLKS